MNFLVEPEPQRGVTLAVAEGIRRIVAPNPGAFTYHGTNTYLIDGPDGVMVVDPGPDDPDHLRAILAATGGQVRKILLSHTHADHLDGLHALQTATRAPTYGFEYSADPRFTPDIPIRDGDIVDGWTALHTPGHAADHLCFTRQDGVVLTADHVMSWSTSVVSPPGGNMRQYFASLERMLARDDRLYLPGHGPAMKEPHGHVQALFDHRRQREAAIVAALATAPQTAAELVEALYVGLAERLKPAAARSVTAHLEKLLEENRASTSGRLWQLA